MLNALQKEDAPLEKENLSRIQDESTMLPEIKNGSSHAVYANLLGCMKRQGQGTRYIKLDRARHVQAHLPEGQHCDKDAHRPEEGTSAQVKEGRRSE